MSQTTILIVDDHEVVREGLRALLNRRENFRVVGEAGSRTAAASRRAGRSGSRGRRRR
jgi:DNA-binding NarL/FixJ family response regulator